MVVPTGLRRRLLFIVSRERVDLYDALREALSEEPDCEVILDRRSGERRSGGAPDGRERRARPRRERFPVDTEIRECGWAVVKVNTWPEAEPRGARPGG